MQHSNATSLSTPRRKFPPGSMVINPVARAARSRTLVYVHARDVHRPKGDPKPANAKPAMKAGVPVGFIACYPRKAEMRITWLTAVSQGRGTTARTVYRRTGSCGHVPDFDGTVTSDIRQPSSPTEQARLRAYSVAFDDGEVVVLWVDPMVLGRLSAISELPGVTVYWLSANGWLAPDIIAPAVGLPVWR